jgi:hypothetical protein
MRSVEDEEVEIRRLGGENRRRSAEQVFVRLNGLDAFALTAG